ncbi:MAG: hypothetical protein IJO06_06060 [Thermoguttaceae bacterium]|nr:hypothetical protein [Thermoguttaceae bacterium]
MGRLTRPLDRKGTATAELGSVGLPTNLLADCADLDGFADFAGRFCRRGSAKGARIVRT